MPVSAITCLLPHPKKSVTGDDIAVYDDGVDTPSAIRAVKFYGVTGKLVRRYELRFDAGSVLNVDNEPVHPDDVYDSMTALGGEDLIVSMIDNSESVWRDQSDTLDIKIEQVRLERADKQEPGTLVVVVTEVI